MELRDTGLNDISRRRFLAHLFDIPPLLLGLAISPQPLGSAQHSAPAPNVLAISKHIDLEEIRNNLTGFWTHNDDKDVLITLDILLKRLYERYPTASLNNQVEIATAICELHIHASNLLHDRGRFTKSLEHLNKVRDLHFLLQEDELKMDVFYRRGGVYLDRGEISRALDDYHAAEQKLRRVSPTLQAAILLETALAEARSYAAAGTHFSAQQRIASLRKIDQAGRIIKVEHTERGREIGPYLEVDLERYHLDRAATMITFNDPVEALQELKQVSFSELKGRRSVYHLILQSQAYLALKEYAFAALLAEEALPFTLTMHSRVNLERIKTLYTQLQHSSFRNNPEVARLGYLLFHI